MMVRENDQQLLDELTSIKKLMVFALLKHKEFGVTQSDLAHVLGISQSQVSKMLTKPGTKPTAKDKDERN